MKALVKTSLGVGCLELIDVPEPECGPSQVKIQVKFAGICGTDIHILKDEFVYYPPVILGHEFSGVIRQIGTGVKKVKEGDRVTVLPSAAVTCGNCLYCRTGKYCFCPSRRGMGHGVNGAFTEYCVVSEDIVFKLADNIDLVSGALSEPLACCVQAVNEIANLSSADIVLISGPGAIGLIVLQLAKLQEARVVVCGTSADRKRLIAARSLGAEVVNVEKDDMDTVVQDLSRGDGVDVAFECAGTSGSVEQCLKSLKPEGTFIQIGIFSGPIQVDFNQIVFKQLKVLGSLGHTWKTWNKTLDILEQEKVHLKPLVSEILPLSRWKDGFAKAQDHDYIKIILEPPEGGET